MAIRVLNDRIKDSVMEMGVPGMMRAVRSYVVEMDGLANYPNDLFADAVLYAALRMEGMPKPGSAHRLDERCLLSRARARPLDDRTAEISLIYERVPLVTVAEDRITVPVSTMNLPGTRHQILASYSGPGWPGVPLVRAASVTYRCPMRRLVIGKAMFGFDDPDPNDPHLLPMSQFLTGEMKQAVGCVNRLPWMGLPNGYWLCEGLRTQAIEPDDAFERCLCAYVSVSFFSQQVQDWSFWRFLQLPSGHFAQVDADVIDELRALGYPDDAPSTRGYGHGIAGGSGVVVTYPYQTADFYQIFGVQ